MNKKKILIWLGIGIVAVILYRKLGKINKTVSTTDSLTKAKEHYDAIMQLYAQAPSGNNLPKEILDEVVVHMEAIEKAGFIIKDDQLVKNTA